MKNPDTTERESDILSQKGQMNEKNRILFRNIFPSNRLLRIATWCFIVYSIIEISDSVAIILIVAGVLPNIYASFLTMAFSPVQDIMINQVGYLLPLYFSFTAIRIVATIGLIKNRMWGFQLGVLSLVFTILFCLVLLPWGFLESMICIGILLVLIPGYYGKRPINLKVSFARI